MKQLLDILDNLNARIELLEEFDEGGRECKRMIAEARKKLDQGVSTT